MQLRPDDVERVVFIDAPSGRYAGDNTAVNFIMKKRESGGYVGLDATQRVGYTSGDYNLSMKYYRRNTQYILFAGTDYSSISGAETERNELISFPEGDISRHYSTTADSERKNSQYVWMRVRNKNDKRTLRATLNIVRNRTPRSFNASELTYSGLAALDGTTIAADRLEKSRSMKYSLGLSGNCRSIQRPARRRPTKSIASTQPDTPRPTVARAMSRHHGRSTSARRQATSSATSTRQSTAASCVPAKIPNINEAGRRPIAFLAKKAQPHPPAFILPCHG